MAKRKCIGFSSKDGLPIKVGAKPNRNDACPCGSMKKYKNCHLHEHEYKLLQFKPK